jgi:alkanesulfonate monooxygenase SsuD/methylene tetrahydromethanopterin reductase-like flavin-dependent oxidoreductase (luciferase family)
LSTDWYEVEVDKEIRLNAFAMNCVGHQSSGLWRHPRDRSRDYRSLHSWLRLAQTLEQGLFDGLFLADVTGVYDVYQGSPDTAIRTAMQIPVNDPYLVIPAMAAATRHLGFGVTGSIPYEPPYAFARKMSTLDHLTDGRIAWNVVTGYLDSAARAIGKSQQTQHDTRYEIADDYMALMYKLWEGSWEDGAVLADRHAGVFADPAKVHPVRHQGEYFQLEAIHLCEPSPQRTPVIFQAGSSPKGQAFAGAHAECVFIGAPSLEATEDLKIFALMCVVVDETDAAAVARREDYRSYALEEGSLALMSGWSGIDLGQFGLDERAEDLKSEAIQTAMAGVGSRTVREWGRSLAIGGAANVLTGSPATVVDQLEEWMDATDIDGFNLAYTVLPECFEDFVGLVVPEMQKRGIYKTDYQDGTLRRKLFRAGDRLSAPHPSVRYRQRAGHHP